MPALTNPKHERFAQELAKGKTADEAYQLAGYAENRGNATRLKANESVAARVAEIQERAAIRVEISVSSVTEALLRIADKAEGLKESAALSVARAAWMDAAKVNGLIVDKSEAKAEQVQRIISDKPQTDEEWAETHGADLGAATGTAARAH